MYIYIYITYTPHAPKTNCRKCNITYKTVPANPASIANTNHYASMTWTVKSHRHKLRGVKTLAMRINATKHGITYYKPKVGSSLIGFTGPPPDLD